MIKIIPYGQTAALIQWEGSIKKKTISEIYQFNKLIDASRNTNIIETIPAYNSILVCYQNSSFQMLKFILEELYKQIDFGKSTSTTKQWKLPMLISSDFIKCVNNQLPVSVQEYYSSFFSILFTIGMKGFLPGFIYLAGLPNQFHISRKNTPDKSIHKRSVAIGGSQCGIYPKESPGGWTVIGTCPIPLIDLSHDELSKFSVGDQLQFYEIDLDQFKKMESKKWTLELIEKEFNMI